MRSNVVGAKASRKKFAFPWAHCITYIVLIAYACFLMFPFATLLLTSLSSEAFIIQQLKFRIPGFGDMTFGNYVDVFTNDFVEVLLENGNSMNMLLLGFVNTIWQVIPTTAIGLFVAGLAAYAYAKLDFPFKKLMYTLQLAIIVLPLNTLTIPSYMFFNMINWTNTALPLVVPGVFGGAVTVFYLSQYMRGIPTEVVDAARIDGLNAFRTYLRIILPLAVPAIVAQAILCFVSGYNNFLGALLYLPGRSDLQPLQLQLYTLVGYWTGFNDSGRMAAATLVSMLPLIIVYIIFRRQFRAGITDGAVKS